MSEKKKDISGNVFDWPVLQRILKLTQPYRPQFYSSIVLAVLLAVLGPLRPFLIQRAVDDYVLQFDASGLLNITMILIGVLLAETFLRYQFTYVSRWLGQHVVKDLRTRVFDHVLKLKLKYFDKTPIGTSTTRTINDVEAVNEIFSNGLMTIIADVLTIIVVISLMLNENWKLALLTLTILPAFLYSTYLFKEGIKDAFQNVRITVSKMNAFLQEHISGMRIVQIFNAEQQEMDKFKAINNEQKKAHIQSIWYYSIFFPAIEILLAIGIGLIVWYGSYLVIQAEIKVGMIIGFILYMNMLFRPLRFIADRFNTLQMGLVAGNRVFELLDTKSIIQDEGEKVITDIQGDIEFENVWFAYEPENYVLKNLNFKVNAGETLAIVGATGSGKTSTINVLSRFYEIEKGAVKVDGENIKNLSLAGLRNHISTVLQDVFLFKGTVFENITLKDESIGREQVYEAAKMIGAHQFIEKLPGGYDYNVMERGATLSMGQRQLISFIRALVFDPKILILDEATSSIDTETEALIQTAIERLVKGRTSIVIAHRLSTIQKADKIMVLDRGEIKEIGSHEALLAKDGFYKNLHDMQFNQVA